eukprot:TRINITY_DN26252_c0_g1_i1.p1 TRINITY_DN26252_c0_g1~~TRINITY_DN26252_c0_g1_i1.p1  ORF type:complete len:114 (-),score=24.85 TRINITY_DN26252_c0_g1_i1:67-408(-)
MKLATLLFCFSLCTGLEVKPPNLADDTFVNTLVSQKRKSGGFVQLHHQTELVAEHPIGSGRVVVIQSGPEFPPEFPQGAAENDLTIELLTEGENTETPVKETPGNFINALKPK